MNQDRLEKVPHLITAVSGPLLSLEQRFLENQILIETWFRKQWQQTPAPFYASVDLRNSGFRLAPVDTNLFPAGFNNLNPEFLPLCIQAVQNTVEKLYFGCQRILLIPESHSRNLFYFENVAVLKQILMCAGFDVRVGSLMTNLNEPKTIDLPSGKSITLQPLIRKGKRITVDSFDACAILLNHDLSEGVPEILQDIDQPIIPPLKIGWGHRLKSNHFNHYKNITEEFAKLVDIDPWFITPLFLSCGEVDFMSHEGEDCLVDHAHKIYQESLARYQTHGIDRKPFIVVKADAGTYGMGVLVIDDPEKLRSLNRKERTRMAKSKGGKKIQKVIIQEGIYSFETIGEEHSVAEPVVYMIGNHVVGGFYRVHTKKGTNESLNAPGMHFVPLAFVKPCNSPDLSGQADSNVNRFYAYGVVARLALLAAAREMTEIGEIAEIE